MSNSRTGDPQDCAFAPRPQLVTYLCFTLFLSILLRYKYFATGRSPVVLPLLMVVRVNAHGGFVIAFPAAGAGTGGSH